MHYFALLLGPEATEPLDAATEAAIMTAYTDFHARAGSAIRAGDALAPGAEAVRIDRGAGEPVITDGPFAEGAEVAGGYYVIEADNLDDALAIARQIPACQDGGVELWPMVDWEAPAQPLGNDWLAILLEPPGPEIAPGSEQWEAEVREHEVFGETYGEHILGGAALHPASTATTVRVRDGEAIFTDGPYAEGAEVAGGFYLLKAADRDEAVKVAAQIPVSIIELRQLSGIAGL